MSSKKQKITRKRASNSTNASMELFRSDFHRDRFESLKTRQFIQERIFAFGNEQCPELQQIQRIMVSKTWTHIPSILKPVATGVVREFYANACLREGDEKDYTSWVRGKVVSYSAATIRQVLQIKCIGKCEVENHRRYHARVWPYDELLSFLCRPGSSWMNFVPNNDPNHVPKRLDVKDLTPIAKAWTSFYHHTIETCSNRSELPTSRAIGVMAIMQNKAVDLGALIADDIFEMANSDSKVLGHSSLIVALCHHAEVEDLLGENVLPLTRAINNAWIRQCITEGEKLDRERARPPQPSLTPQAQVGLSQNIGDETSREHLLRMEDFCFKQDVCARLGISANYLVHQTDTWAAAQRYRERYSGPPPGPHFGWFQPHPLPQPRLQLGVSPPVSHNLNLDDLDIPEDFNQAE